MCALLARAGQGFLLLWLLPRQSRAVILWSPFLLCSATWTFIHKPGAVSSPLSFLLLVILTSCLASHYPPICLSLCPCDCCSSSSSFSHCFIAFSPSYNHLLSPCFISLSVSLWFIQWFREWKFRGNKICFHPSSLDAHVAVLFFYFLALGFCVCDLYEFSTAVFTGNARVFDVSASLYAMQINWVISNRLDPADLGNKARAI